MRVALTSDVQGYPKNKTPTIAIGFGVTAPLFSVYIGNRPELIEFENLTSILPFQKNDIKRLSDATGNHWRKVFNVYAKLMFELHAFSFSSWQQYRDEYLLQSQGETNLLFSPPDHFPKNEIRIVTGKTYAEKLGVLETCVPLEVGFYIDIERRLIVCPYFDYRQMSNMKIQYLANLIRDTFGSQISDLCPAAKKAIRRSP